MCYLKSALPLLLAFSASVEAGEFINLGFDEPDLSGRLVRTYLGGAVIGAADEVLRGWTATADGAVVREVTYALRSEAPGGLYFNLLERESDSKYGNYLLLASPTSEDGTLGPDLWLSQTATVPEDATGIRVFGNTGVEGYVNGTKIGDINPFIGGSDIWDLRPYQGKEVTLRIHVKAGDVKTFDIVGFTTVPEPSEYVMFGLGLGLLGWQGWKRRGGRGSTQAPSTFADPV